MKRDLDLVREILTAARNTSAEAQSWNLVVPNRHPCEVAEHVDILIEAGLLKATVFRAVGLDAPRIRIERLTWSGHDFIDAASDDKLWNRAKEKLREATSTVAFDVVTELLTFLAKKQLGL